MQLGCNIIAQARQWFNVSVVSGCETQFLRRVSEGFQRRILHKRLILDPWYPLANLRKLSMTVTPRQSRILHRYRANADSRSGLLANQQSQTWKAELSCSVINHVDLASVEAGLQLGERHIELENRGFAVWCIQFTGFRPAEFHRL